MVWLVLMKLVVMMGLVVLVCGLVVGSVVGTTYSVQAPWCSCWFWVMGGGR